MASKSIILGVDPARSTGLALLQGRRRLSSTTVVMPTTTKRDHVGDRLTVFRGLLHDQFDAWSWDGGIDLIVIEWAQSMRSGSAMAMHGYIRNLVLEWACLDSIATLRVGPSTVKKFATGKGNATKEEMLATAAKRWRFKPETHDEADAVWIAEYGRKTS